MATFKVNDYTSIEDFELIGIYQKFMKHGSPSLYEKFIGTIDGKDVTGWQCVADLNIYKMEYISK